jgi:hypothetical protein
VVVKIGSRRGLNGEEKRMSIKREGEEKRIKEGRSIGIDRELEELTWEKDEEEDLKKPVHSPSVSSDPAFSSLSLYLLVYFPTTSCDIPFFGSSTRGAVVQSPHLDFALPQKPNPSSPPSLDPSRPLSLPLVRVPKAFPDRLLPTPSLASDRPIQATRLPLSIPPSSRALLS